MRKSGTAGNDGLEKNIMYSPLCFVNSFVYEKISRVILTFCLFIFLREGRGESSYHVKPLF